MMAAPAPTTLDKFDRFRAEACLTLEKLYNAICHHQVECIAECFQTQFQILKNGKVWDYAEDEGDGIRTRRWIQELYRVLYRRFPNYTVVEWTVVNIRMNPSQRWANLRVRSTIEDSSTKLHFREYAIYWFDLSLQAVIEEHYDETREGLVKKNSNSGIVKRCFTGPPYPTDLPDLLRQEDVLSYIHVLPLIRKVDFVQRDEDLDYDEDSL